jgi:hypothetical protein
MKMALIRTKDGAFPANRVEEVILRDYSRNPSTVVVDDRDHEAAINTDKLEVLMGTVIVPTEKYRVLRYWSNESGDEHVEETPVVAFVLVSLGYLQPLVLTGIPDADDGILRPDGKVELGVAQS